MKKLTVAAFRKELGLSLEAFAARIGVASKGYVSKIERGVETPSVNVALAIEKLSDGRIDAGELNSDVKASRQSIPPENAPAVETPDRVIVCAVCEKRVDGSIPKSCTFVDCPHSSQSASQEIAA